MKHTWSLKKEKTNEQGHPSRLFQSQQNPSLFKRVQFVVCCGHTGLAARGGWLTEYTVKGAQNAGVHAWARSLAEASALLEKVTTDARIQAYNENSDLYTPRPV